MEKKNGGMDMKEIKVAYIGGGSKAWARIFMNDLAMAEDLGGEVALYDIDPQAAERNQKLGNRLSADPRAKSRFLYTVAENLPTALKGADFVIISILPGTFEDMRSDVHAPEKYGVWQSVGDTAGPGGVLRAMRTVPLYEGFARAIRDHCPKAWVMNYTNPMSICVKALYDVFPGIKAFGCCHEVFGTQEFLAAVVSEQMGIPRPGRSEIITDVSGINHFTWITKARWGDVDVMKLLPAFIDRFYEEGYSEHGDREAWKHDCFAYGNKVKENLFRRYGVLGAAGDRHLAEFLPGKWYLGSPEDVKAWQFSLTTVDYRIAQADHLRKEAEDLAEGRKEVYFGDSGEEGVDLMKALLGLGDLASNANLPNNGQMPAFPHGAVVETNCVFSKDSVKPVRAYGLPGPVRNLVYRACQNVEDLYDGIRRRDRRTIFAAFVNQALCGNLTLPQAESLFAEMCRNTRGSLKPFFDLEAPVR